MSLKALKGIRQLRFLLCQHSPSSNALRNYIAGNYQHIRNSHAMITIRESEFTQPSIIATYGFGIQKKINLKDKSEAQIDKAIQQLQSRSQKIAAEIKI